MSSSSSGGGIGGVIFFIVMIFFLTRGCDEDKKKEVKTVEEPPKIEKVKTKDSTDPMEVIDKTLENPEKAIGVLFEKAKEAAEEILVLDTEEAKVEPVEEEEEKEESGGTFLP